MLAINNGGFVRKNEWASISKFDFEAARSEARDLEAWNLNVGRLAILHAKPEAILQL